ncbi:MAG: transposase family protein [Desulfobulbaceae bacterium]|nr:transposase family protein [Desulfobulbaceae bacterium]
MQTCYPDWPQKISHHLDQPFLMTMMTSLALDSTSEMEEIIKASKSDRLLSQIAKYMVTTWPPKKSLSGDLLVFFKHREELSAQGDCIFLGDRLIIPSERQQPILNLLHSGHPGRIRMQQKYRDSYFWPGGTERVNEFVKNCNACSLAGKNSQSEPVRTTAIPPPTQPWKKVAIDITGPFWTAPKHERFIVVLSDYFSKYPEILFTGKTTACQIVSWLKEVFGRFGYPDELISDNGPQFTCTIFRSFLASNNVKHNLSAVYNPYQNGLVEVFNRSLKKGSQVISCEKHPNFREGILDLVISFRSTAPENGASPYKLLLGYSPRTKSDVRNPVLFQSGGGDIGIDDYMSRNKNSSNSLVPTASGCRQHQNSDPHLSMEEKKQIVQEKFNQRRYGQDPSKPIPKHPYHVGDIVTTKRPPAEIHKGQSSRSQPLRIQKVVGRWTYQLEDGSIWNARKLKRFRPVPDRRQQEEDHILNTHRHRPAPQGSPAKERRQSHRNQRAPDRFSPGK